uniref:Uncharacterized protein n=1 Tax=Labrus bergylta TaxID=56723 RepID=A0A3Q3E405_9LABR
MGYEEKCVYCVCVCGGGGGRDAAAAYLSFILHCLPGSRHENSSKITATFTFYHSHSFSLSASTLLLFPGAKCYPSPDFGIKVLFVLLGLVSPIFLFTIQVRSHV